MLLLYTILSSFGALVLLPILPLVVCRRKYRKRLLQRLGFGLAGQLRALPCKQPSAPTFWIHALSVGEVTSALPLVRGLRESYPEARIFLSVTTSSGALVAQQHLAVYIDAVIAGPLDLGPVALWFVKIIEPDLFILVETDFWPHWLHCLARNQVPMLLVNGRISSRSFAQYRRFAFLCRPMFQDFTLLSMQTSSDAEKITALGIGADKVVTLGNLKFDISRCETSREDKAPRRSARKAYGFDAAAPLWICGSTHRGEEEILFQVYCQLRQAIPALQLLLAPRNIERADEIMALSHQYQIELRKWTSYPHRQGPLLILDTIGELAGCYVLADAVFIGGSLVPQGGHNPIEPAAAGVPVLFGPHMEDFAEIAAELIECGGARQVASAASLSVVLRQIINDPGLHRSMAGAALGCVDANRGVVCRHLEAITVLLSRNTTDG
jgi:3-deoxy-D-manno-octulosonic-acid transferase